MQTRSTARSLASRKLVSEKVTEDVPAEHSQTDHTPHLVKKPRREETPAPKKRRRGKQREICQLNLDVLFLIAAYIHPIDLLNLARTCKSVRQLLMDKSSAFVWKEARRQVTGLPDCPADLTEPEYANLVFYARCYGCGKYAKTILWEMRCRYCLDCRIGRLCSLSTCHNIIRRNYVLAREHITIEGETAVWVDREQMETFMQEYYHSSDEKQFIREKKEQYDAIVKHARLCEKWQRDRSSEHKAELEVRRQERANSIFERLKRLGYEREVAYFSSKEIQSSCKALFGKSKPLTEKEWNKIWPEWIESMNDFRFRRLDKVVYEQRRHLLALEYANHRLCTPPNTPAFDLLPNVVDLACFPPFRDIITAPEGTLLTGAFEYAFARLPHLVDDWKKKLDTEVAALVNIPRFTTEGSSKSTPVSSGGKAGSESTQTITDKLRLACVLFRGHGGGIFTYTEMLFGSISLKYCAYESGPERDLHDCGSFKERYNIKYIEKAPYVIHACGLDPNLATVDDMNRRDPRLKCQSCSDSRVWRWRDAVWHADVRHYQPAGPEWQLVSDEYVADFQLATDLSPYLYRCLLCLPSVGDAKSYDHIYDHLTRRHKIDTAQKGVHFAPVGLAPSWYY